jgi:hypothetical protein
MLLHSSLRHIGLCDKSRTFKKQIPLINESQEKSLEKELKEMTKRVWRNLQGMKE